MRESAATNSEIGFSPIAEIRAALSFLTRLSVERRSAGRRDEEPAEAIAAKERAHPPASATTGAGAFAVVGAVLGLVAGLPLVALGPGHALVGALLAIGVLALLDGGLHLDGLGDTFDALAAPAGSEERARTDPRAGTASVVAIVVVLAVDGAALADLGARSAPAGLAAIVLAAAISRAIAPVASTVAGGWRRSPAGLATWFVERTSSAQAVASVVTAVALVLIVGVVVGPRLAAGAVIGSALAGCVAIAIAAARRQLDGDGYGAIIELAFAAVLVVSAIVA
jgi:adenosylcobinamide-GDP ribazoletransferase